jgi:hypothetical protein
VFQNYLIVIPLGTTSNDDDDDGDDGGGDGGGDDDDDGIHSNLTCPQKSLTR